MLRKSYGRVIVFLISILLLSTCFFPLSAPLIITQKSSGTSRISEGHILFAPMNSGKTYLINALGEVNHTWSSIYLPGLAVYWLYDDTILRTIRLSPSGPGAGGGIQKVAWDGTVLWEYQYYTDDVLSHHDIEPLPNGNVLMIAWETKTASEAIAAGRDPGVIQGEVLPDHIIEVQPTGPSSGDIVWEWHAWDHLIQDFDPTKENYGVVADHPELININYGSKGYDWLHCNSIDYNEEFDQIMVSCLYFDEIWVIDHSTTTAEAGGHSGGNSGKGGDLLYRWGNPQAYGAGNANDQKLFDQHDSGWIEAGCPGEGNILIFNNGPSRPNGRYSSVDEIIPPVDSEGNYMLTPGSAYGPADPVWIYTASNPTDFKAYFLSGAQRLENGNTLICDGPAGRFFEVTSDKVTVWQYLNHFPSPLLNNVFKIQYVYPEKPPVPNVPDLECEGGFHWNDIKPGEMVNGTFQVFNVGDLGSLLNWKIVSYPEWGNWSFDQGFGMNLTPEHGTFYVNVTVIAPELKETEFDGFIRIENQNDSNDHEFISVYLKTPDKVNVLKGLFYECLDRIFVRHFFHSFFFNWFLKITGHYC